MNYALLWKLKAEAISARSALENLVKTPYVLFSGINPFEITFYLGDASSEFCYILSLWQEQRELERASALAKAGTFDYKIAGLQSVAQSQFQLTWEYCILPRALASSYLCVMKAPADLSATRFEEMKNSHRNYMKQVAGLNRVWAGQSLNPKSYTTLFRADWDSSDAQHQFLGITTVAAQKRENYMAAGFEVEYALTHLLDLHQVAENRLQLTNQGRYQF